jgi:hypothetical protein
MDHYLLHVLNTACVLFNASEPLMKSMQGHCRMTRTIPLIWPLPVADI